MKKKIVNKSLIILILIIQIVQMITSFTPVVYANIKEGDSILLKGDHECDSLLEYWMVKEKRWSYKIVWYVYYEDPETFERYPAFCVEPQKKGVGTGYDQYYTTVTREYDNRIWRILNKGYMGTTYTDWNLECDDDFYSATKVALHSLAEGVAPVDKYILGNRSVDGNTVEEIQRRGQKVLNVAQILYEYGINGTEVYVAPNISIEKQKEEKMEEIEGSLYYTVKYKVIPNKTLKSYEVDIQNFTQNTKILNMQNQEQNSFTTDSFKIAIPVDEIKQNIQGNIYIKNAYIKTNPIYYCDSNTNDSQNYVTYVFGYEKTETSTTLDINSNNCSLYIKKVDKETLKPIKGVIFEIQDLNRNKIAQITTDENGIAELKNLSPQEVIVKEVKTKEPYILSDKEERVTLQWGKTSEVTFENEKKKGALKIRKVDADNNEIVLDKVEFNLLNEKGEIVKKIVTNEKGEAYVDNLDIGNYILKETKTNTGYDLCENLEIKIEWNKVTQKVIENKKQKGQIEVYKVDSENKEKLQGVIFEVLDKNQKRVETIVTNKDGYAITSKLPVGTYYLKEIKTKDKYLLNDQLIKVEVQKDKVQTLIVYNKKIKGQIKIIKISEDDNLINGKPKGTPIENVEFVIRDEKQNVVEIIKTNNEGIAYSSDLEKGIYTIKEIKTDKDYVLNEEEILVEISKDNQIEEITITNKSKELPKLPRTGF